MKSQMKTRSNWHSVILRQGALVALLMLIMTLAAPASGVAFAGPQGADPTTPILVKFKGSASKADMAAATTAAGGGKTVREMDQIRTTVINVPAAARDKVLAAFAKQASVERASAAVKVSKASVPNDPEYAKQWALPKVGWDQAYGVVSVGGSAKIAVVDTGVDASHPDLSGRMAGGQSFLEVPTADPNVDPNGHGTALAGIAAASVNNSAGVAGVAYSGASVSSVQVLGADGTGSDAEVVPGILWAADNGAKVILMGFSTPTYSAALADALAYAWGKGVVLVAATGNDGSSSASYPAGIPNVIGVAATDSGDKLAAGSNTGSAAVAAPGSGIHTTLPGGRYGNVGGTSAASAHVAGLAALLTAGGKSNSDASGQIRGATDPVAGQSFGRINVAKALGAPIAPPPTPVATGTPTATPTPGPAPTYTTAGSATISGTVTDSVTGSPIVGATVECTVYNGCNSGVSFFTDLNGTYSLTVQFSGSSTTVTISASKTGYKNSTLAVAVSNSTNPKDKNFVLEPSLSATTLSVGVANGTYGNTTTLSATLNVGSNSLAGKTVTFKLNGTDVGTATTNSSGVATLANVSLAGINVGAYESGVEASFAGDSAHIASSGNATLTITKAPLTISADAKSKVYGSENPVLTGLITGIRNNDAISAIYSTSADATSPVGSYAIVPAALDSSPSKLGNYDVSLENGTLNITKATPTIEWTIPAEITYGTVLGAAQLNATATYNGNTVSGTFAYTPAAGAILPVGTNQPLKVDFAPADATNYSTASKTVLINVTKANQTIAFGALTNKTYGNAPFEVSATASSGLLVSFAASGNCAIAGSMMTITGAGSCVVTASQTGDSNFNAATPVSQSFTISRATATIVLSDLTHIYDGSPKAATVTTSPAGLSGVAITYDGSTTAPTNAGSYSVVASLANPNYQAESVGGTMVIGKATAGITLGGLNHTYNGSPRSASVTTNPAELNVHITYDGSANSPVNAGTYEVVATVEERDYQGTATGSLYISKASASVTPAAASKTYGDADPALTGNLVGFLGGDNVTATYARTGGETVGTYTISATLAPAGVLSNYDITYNTATFTINQALLIITANNKGREYANLNPPLDGYITGIKYGDGITATYSTDAADTSPVGEYSIMPFAVDSEPSKLENYEVKLVAGKLTISNTGPTIVSLVGTTVPVAAITGQVTVSVEFRDPGLRDKYEVTWDWGDGANLASTAWGVPVDEAGIGSAKANHTYAAPGVYTVTVTVKDGASAVDAEVFQYAVVYDPSAGFVTGGGWINSPAGACKTSACTDDTIGKANFGFVSKYQKGANTPTGETEFQFKAGNLNFHSSSYDWLVVAGAKAQYKGTGTINGQGDYGFMLSAVDGQANKGGDQLDKFRIKIWDKANGDTVVYDNQMDAAEDALATTSLGGGSIVVHSK